MAKPLHFVEHEISDNTILTNKKPNLQNRHTVLLGAEKVVVGITNPERRVIKVNPVTGLNYETDATETYEVYNLRKQHHGCFFILDLETGGRGWYPGSKKVGDVGENVDVKLEPNDESEVVETISNVTVDVKDTEYDGIKRPWYLIKYEEYEGYILASSISNLRYVDREY